MAFLLGEHLMSAHGHLVELPGSAWKLWKWVCVRGAGFPAKDVLKLAAIETPSVGDRLFQAEDDLEEARGQLRRALPRGRGQPDSRRFARSLEENPGREVDLAPDARLAVEALRDARRKRDVLVAECKSSFLIDLERIRSEVKSLARNKSFREALIWKNRRVLDAGIAQLLRAPDDASDGDIRQKEAFVASCVRVLRARWLGKSR
jgi:hypothetical protein